MRSILVTLALTLGSIAFAATANDVSNLIEKGDTKGAVTMALTINNSDALAYAARATSYSGALAPENERRAIYEKAEDYARKAIEMDKNNGLAHFELARALGRKAQFVGILESLPIAPEVRRELETAIKLDPKLAGAYVALAVWNAEIASKGAIVAGSLGADFDNVRPNMQKAIQLEPGEIIHRLEFAKALLKDGNRRSKAKSKQEAIAALEAAVKLEAKDFWAKRDLAEARALLTSLR
ncbi:hypothetical protein [Deinococcus cellulosilyticus]|uniref:Tetratricopeptide repeat protein n=1 Tax=Deinococcus cellulosilyticus (strain DSM 18568 / NBRC 106333 / KACC 11606 / 5516J-15) TaxID=1223518 RepID=A0A511N9B3_DEIC1|nr:hypothetical protein [Deinococcus cellulosilyticus]GEM49423.1 hypothetical protein DC3_50580 [Deinococcus cellulosilyticus NBRC 106333 = KACC 11606]